MVLNSRIDVNFPMISYIVLRINARLLLLLRPPPVRTRTAHISNRYLQFSVFGSKERGPLDVRDEKVLKKFIKDSLRNGN